MSDTIICDRCDTSIDTTIPSGWENLEAMEVSDTDTIVCESCITRAERGWIDTILHSGHVTKSDIWPEYAGECDICDLPVLYGEDEHNRETGNHLSCDGLDSHPPFLPSFTRGRYRADWVDLGEGRLRFDTYEFADGGWEMISDGSYCTAMPVGTNYDTLEWVLERIVADLHACVDSPKRMLEAWSWVDQSWAEVTA